ncbi:hypothetical protein BCR35DRAFT_298132 [Leucosporidium creatinivorum]|uniref:Guanine nucleotide exchange factor Vps9 n=1 Tax=Leucosporidium creatinivorum TaxID=106004 RepID=A0A1Y2G407_9BASI|nr:hypothetical protein BCR35DRAFT_298132 [Leucosporidium creatinivorum]
MSAWDDQQGAARDSAPPQLPPFEETGDVWASTAPPASTAGNDAQSLLAAVAHPLPHSMLADLDPFAPPPASSSSSAGSNYQPTYTTLGHHVAPASLLEILPPESDGEPSPSPTTSGFTHLPTAFQLDGEGGAQSQAPTPPEHDGPRPPAKPASGAGLGSPPPPTSSSPSNFFSGVFRSISSSAATTPTPSSPAPPTPSKPTISTQTALQRTSSTEGAAARLREELNEKAGTGSSASSGRGATTTDLPPSSTSHLPKPLASIASVFRSPLASRTSSPSSTPLGTSPTNSRGGDPARVGGAGSGREKEGGSSRMEKGGAGGSREGKERQKQDEEAQFDFNRFLEQMRSRSADPIAKYLRSFLKEFSRRPPISTADQIRVINDFLDFIATKMRGVDPWRSYWREYEGERAEEEFEMSMEAMEKLVMNRVWHLTFTPALDLSTLPNETSPTGDVERDAILSQRIKLFAWIKPSHLDLPIPDPEDDEEEGAGPSRGGTPKLPEDLLSGGEDEGGEKDQGVEGEKKVEEEKRETPEEARAKARQVQGFLDFARRELGKMNQYKAPRDKLICVLNCCKVIFGLIRHLSTKEEGADTFIPFLIYVVLKSNPEHLVSNLQYIQRFRNPEKLSGEGGYYLSSLNGAISFIETVDASSLSNITQEDFETNVATAIRNLPQPDDSPRLTRPPQFPSPSTSPNPGRSPNRSPNPNRSPDLGRGGETPRPRPPPLSTNTTSPSAAPPADLPLTSPEGTDVDSPSLLQQPGLSFPSTAKGFLLRSTDSVERIVSKPLGAIGRIFEQLDQAVSDTGVAGPRMSPRGGQQPLPAIPGVGGQQGQPQGQLSERRSGSLEGMYAGEGTTAEEVSREIDRQTEERRMASIGTLKNVFPNLEDEVLEMVLLSNSGDMAKTIDALLEMS